MISIREPFFACIPCLSAFATIACSLTAHHLLQMEAAQVEDAFDQVVGAFQPIEQPGERENTPPDPADVLPEAEDAISAVDLNPHQPAPSEKAPPAQKKRTNPGREAAQIPVGKVSVLCMLPFVVSLFDRTSS